jgi:hypothetical protein
MAGEKEKAVGRERGGGDDTANGEAAECLALEVGERDKGDDAATGEDLDDWALTVGESVLDKERDTGANSPSTTGVSTLVDTGRLRADTGSEARDGTNCVAETQPNEVTRLTQNSRQRLSDRSGMLID